MFVAFLALYWIQRSRRSEIVGFPADFSPVLVRPSPFAIVPLGVCAWAGILAAYASWTHPFSKREGCVRVDSSQSLDRLPLAGTPDYSAVNVAEHLGRPMYFPECECTDIFMQFGDGRDHFSEDAIPGTAWPCGRTGPPTLFNLYRGSSL